VAVEVDDAESGGAVGLGASVGSEEGATSGLEGSDGAAISMFMLTKCLVRCSVNDKEGLGTH
jgi:hypothetical protein